MKRITELCVLMVMLIGLGVVLVWSRGSGVPFEELRPGAWQRPFRIGQMRGAVEVAPDAADPLGYSFRLLHRDGAASEVIDGTAFRDQFGDTVYEDVTTAQNPLFRLFNITSWFSFIWIAVGFGGQTLFFLRMFVQWLTSEKAGASVVPEIFWWMSLIGGIALFAYFIWRVDLIGVLGQSSGIVIYARNLRLIHKHRNRADTVL